MNNNEVTPRLSRGLIAVVALAARLTLGTALTTVLAQDDQSKRRRTAFFVLGAAVFTAFLLSDGVAGADADKPSDSALEPQPQCSDGQDNDGDGKTDFGGNGDPGCESATDDSESPDLPPPPLAACSDGQDNDGDGKTDFPADPGCSSASDEDETDPPPNQPPVADNDSYKGKEDKTLNVGAPGVLSGDTDPEDDALTAKPVSKPSNGKLTLNANGSFTYKPKKNFNGTDSFTYRACETANLTICSAPATVTIKVKAVPG
jgi:VCBS repeat-containing protein